MQEARWSLTEAHCVRRTGDPPFVPMSIFSRSLPTAEDAEIVLTVPCNNDCTFCSAKHFSLEPPLEQIRYQLMKAVESGARRVNFTGGEPTLRKDIFEILDYARRLGIPGIYLKTNGRKLKDLDFARELARRGVTTMQISLHGATPDVHDPIVQQPGALTEALEGLANALTLEGVAVNTLSVTIRQNYRHLPDIARLVAAYGVRAHFFAHVYPVGAAWDRFDEVVPTYAEAAPYQVEAFRVLDAAGVLGTVDNLPPCFVPGWEHWLNLLYYREIPNAAWHKKGPRCGECIYDRVCDGITHQYAEARGYDELVPVVEREPAPERAAAYRVAPEASVCVRSVLREKASGGTLYRAPRLSMLTDEGVALVRRLRDESGRLAELAEDERRFVLSLYERGLVTIEPEPEAAEPAPAAPGAPARFEAFGLRALAYPLMR